VPTAGGVGIEEVRQDSKTEASLPAAVGGVAWEAAAARALADRRLAEGLDAGTLAEVRAVVGDAARQGLPVEPLVARALAGVEMGAPAPRVVGAVRALAARLVAARDALAPATSAAEVTAGADALAVGVPAAALRDLRRLSPGRSTAVALGVLAQLVSRGVPPARAAAAVTTLVRRGVRPGQLAGLDAAVQADVAAGVPAARALDARARGLAEAGWLAEGPLVAPLSPAPAAVGAAGDLPASTPGRPGTPVTPPPTTTGGPTSTPTPPPRLPPRRP
jgi:hypothetical protein